MSTSTSLLFLAPRHRLSHLCSDRLNSIDQRDSVSTCRRRLDSTRCSSESMQSVSISLARAWRVSAAIHTSFGQRLCGPLHSPRKPSQASRVKHSALAESSAACHSIARFQLFFRFHRQSSALFVWTLIDRAFDLSAEPTTDASSLENGATIQRFNKAEKNWKPVSKVNGIMRALTGCHVRRDPSRFTAVTDLGFQGQLPSSSFFYRRRSSTSASYERGSVSA